MLKKFFYIFINIEFYRIIIVVLLESNNYGCMPISCWDIDISFDMRIEERVGLYGGYYYGFVGVHNYSELCQSSIQGLNLDQRQFKYYM